MDAPTLTPLDRDRLIREHMRFARHLARTHAWDAESLEEATGDAYVGLVQAAQRFNPAAGAPFSSYAGLRIVGAIRDGQRCRDHLSRGDRRKLQAGQLLPEWGMPAMSLADILEDTDLEDGHEMELPTLDADPCRALQVRQAVGRLRDRERQIVVLLDAGVSGREIATALGVTESRVSHILRHVKTLLAAELAEAA